MVWVLVAVGAAVVVGLLVAVERLQRRRSRTDDVHAGSARSGVFGLGEAPARVHHRMGNAGQPKPRE